MPYDEYLADRIRRSLKDHKAQCDEKKMFGGIAFMVDDKMCMGVIRDQLMARVGPNAYEEALRKPGAQPMDFTGRPMKGYIFVDSVGIDNDDQLDHWTKFCLAYNPEAKSSRKKSK